MMPTADFRKTVTAAPRELPKGLDSLVARGIGAARRSSLFCRRLERSARAAFAEYEALENIGSAALQTRISAHQIAARRTPKNRALELQGLALASEHFTPEEMRDIIVNPT